MGRPYTKKLEPLTFTRARSIDVGGQILAQRASRIGL